MFAHSWWFSPGTPASSTTQTRRHNIAESGVKNNKINQKAMYLFINLINSILNQMSSNCTVYTCNINIAGKKLTIYMPWTDFGSICFLFRSVPRDDFGPMFIFWRRNNRIWWRWRLFITHGIGNSKSSLTSEFQYLRVTCSES